MKDVLKAIKQIQARSESTHGKVKEFFKSDTTTEQVNGLEKKIQMFLNYIQVFSIAWMKIMCWSMLQLVANLDNNFQLHVIATAGILPGANL